MDSELGALFDALPGLVWSASSDGRAEILNGQWRAYTGSGLVAADWEAAIHPQDLPHWRERWRSARASGGPWELDVRLRRFDGTYRWFVCRASPLTDAAGTILRWCGIFSDVQDRWQALRTIEKNFSGWVESFPGLMVTMDVNGDVQLFSREVLEYFGKTREQLRGWKLGDAVHPEDLPRVIAAFTEAVTTGTPYSIEHRCRRADGVYRWFHVRALAVRDRDERVTGWYVVLADIDDLKRAEHALRASERDLTLIINTIPAIAWSASADGRAEFFNQHYLEFVGLTAGQALDAGWTVAVHPEDLPVVAADWRRIMASGQSGEGEVRLRRHDGAYRWFLYRANPLRDERGAIVKWYGVNTDIEDRRRAEAELRRTYDNFMVAEAALGRARSELAHVARVTTLGTWTASIAHEVNQPLSGIITNANTCLRLLDAEPPNLEGARETALRILRDGNRASAVITRLRALFSKREFTLESLDLNEAAREVIALSLGELQRNRVSVQWELAGDLPPIVGDRVQLQQVILNLLRNALDAMVAVGDRARQLSIRTEREDGNCVRLSVRDSGVGLDGQSADNVFAPFYTTKSDGMGIGVSVSRSIIQSHGGRIWAASNEGPGATFAFSIPVRSAQAADDLEDGVHPAPAADSGALAS